VDAEAEMNLRTVRIAVITAAIPLCYLLNKLYLIRRTQLKEGKLKKDQTAPV
jgi:hypothetical protein